MRDLIHRFKYDHAVYLKKALSLLMQRGAEQFILNGAVNLIVPVPLHRSRLRQRGFNQASLLAGHLARHGSIPMTPDILIRTRPTIPQVELSAEERKTNVNGAFAVKRAADIQGKSILLLDDVMTTGSTMNECAKMLKKSGATRVVALAIARTPH
jgi:ComF family protein